MIIDMILIEPNIYSCPHCESLTSRLNWMSANTFDGILYSDNKAIYPNCPEVPYLTKCYNCNSFLWLSKICKIEFPENFRQEAELKSNEAEFLSTQDLFKAIETGFIEKDEIFFVRISIWHSYNDRIRAGNGNLFEDRTDEIRWKENLEELKKLFDPNDQYHILLTAEIERNLNNFNVAKLLLNSVNDENLHMIKQQIIKACDNRISEVLKLESTQINSIDQEDSEPLED
jgi:hypothetical protein